MNARKNPNEMSFLEHLEELRWHLIRATVAVLAVAVFVFVFLKSLIFDRILFAPAHTGFFTYRALCRLSKVFSTDGLCIEKLPFTLQSLGMAEQFSMHLWISFITGVIIAFPYILWEFWKFIRPGLLEKERRYASAFIIISSMLFFSGILFGYYVITPLSINFLGNYTISESIEKNFQVSSYFSIIKTSVLAAGLMFELPVIIYFLSKLGLVTQAFLRTYRKHAIVLVLVLAAVVTPPDILSQIIVTIPVILLYEVSIVIAGRIERKLAREEQNEIVKK